MASVVKYLLMRESLARIFALVFILAGSVQSLPEELSNFNNNNYLVQKKDEGSNKSTFISSVKLSDLKWETLDKLTPEYSEALENYKAPFDIPSRYVYYLAGYDHDDRPIWIAEGSKWNLMEGVLKGQTKEMEIYFKQMAHTIIKSIPKRSTPDNPVTQAVGILDFDSFDFTQLRHIPTVAFGVSQATKTFGLIEKYTGEAYVVNANYATEVLMSMAKPFWGGVFGKVAVYGTNKEAWIPKLLKALPKKSIPNWYGGEKNFKPVQVYGK